MAARPKIKPEEDMDDIPANNMRVSRNDNQVPSAEPAAKIKEKKEKKRKKEGGLAGKLLPIFILLLIIVSLVGILVYNAFDIREKYLRTTIDKIPIIRNLLPASEESADEYAGMTRDDLTAQIAALEKQIKDAEASAQDQDRRITMYLEEIEKLKVFQDQQLEFADEKARFERMIAEGDPAAYASFYESMWPENAAELYKSAIETVNKSTEWKKYINTAASMDESSAARMLEEMVATDMSIVVDVMRNLKVDQSGAILSVMDQQIAAAVYKQMYPQ